MPTKPSLIRLSSLGFCLIGGPRSSLQTSYMRPSSQVLQPRITFRVRPRREKPVADDVLKRVCTTSKRNVCYGSSTPLGPASQITRRRRRGSSYACKQAFYNVVAYGMDSSTAAKDIHLRMEDKRSSISIVMNKSVIPPLLAASTVSCGALAGLAGFLMGDGSGLVICMRILGSMQVVYTAGARGRGGARGGECGDGAGWGVFPYLIPRDESSIYSGDWLELVTRLGLTGRWARLRKSDERKRETGLTYLSWRPSILVLVGILSHFFFFLLSFFFFFSILLPPLYILPLPTAHTV